MPIISEKKRGPLSLISDRPLIGLDFHYQSRFVPGVSDEDFLRIEAFNRDPSGQEKTLADLKSYPLATTVPLQASEETLNKSTLLDCLLKRRSSRNFAERPMSFAQLATLLCLSYGPTSPQEPILRTAPSAGARLPIELYAFVMNVEGLSPGIYHYNSRHPSLERLRELSGSQTREILQNAGYGQGTFLKNACVAIIMTAVFRRTIAKYGMRGWRFIFEDAGYIGQNIGLICAAMGLSHTPYGGGFDAEISRVLDFDQQEEGLVLSAIVGCAP